MSTLYVMCGCPGSGKSTYAKEHFPKAVYACADDVRECLYGNAAIQGNPKEVFEVMGEGVKAFLAAGQDVVYDTTAVTSKLRRQIIKKFNVPTVCIFMNTPVEECKKRNAARSRVVPEEVIDRMARKLTVPTLEEGFSEIKIINT